MKTAWLALTDFVASLVLARKLHALKLQQFAERLSQVPTKKQTSIDPNSNCSVMFLFIQEEP